MTAYYQGKSALVTGAASGIGRSLAIRLAEAGASPIGLLDINEEGAKKTAAALAQTGARSLVYACDVSKKDSVKAAIDAFASEAGRLDFVFNNAGMRFSTDEAVPLADRFEKVVQVNMLGEIFGSIFALEHMKKQRSGHIVNVASVAGLVPGISGMGYSSAKCGVVGYSMNARAEYQRFGVRVSVLCPSAIATPMEGFAGEGETAVKQPSKSVRYMQPGRFAEIALKAVAKNRAIAPIGFWAVPLWLGYRFSPALYLSALKRFDRFGISSR